jgi:TetR/AcrR family transcriptional repressor of nem operon
MIESKAERTTNYILETVAPYFNKHGYTATSMSDLTKATGLTKGAIYGNFESKEDLSLKAFDYNIKRVIMEMRSYTQKAKTPLDKLYALTAFYRIYHDYTSNLGGCPILNVGVDANNNNGQLHKRVKQVITELQDKMIYLIEKGIEAGQLKPELNPKIYARRIFALMEGSIFMSITMESGSYIKDMMNFIDQMIATEMAV